MLKSPRIPRRAVLLGGLSLAAACTELSDFVPSKSSTTYDGSYEILVSRVVTDSEGNRSKPNKVIGKERELARLVAVAQGGVLSLVTVEDDLKDVGPNYNDFKGRFLSNGTLQLSATTSYLTSKRQVGTVSLRQNIGDQLLLGNQLKVRAENINDNWGVILRIRKM